MQWFSKQRFEQWVQRGPKPQQPKKTFREMLRHYMVPLAGIVLTLGLWIALTLPSDSDTGVLEVGSPSPITIRAPRSVEFISESQTASQRAQAENRTENFIYQTDLTIPSEQRQKLDKLLAAITTMRNDPTLTNEEQLEKLGELSSATVVLTGTMGQNILNLEDDEWDEVHRRSLIIYDRAVSEHSYEITEEALQRLLERTLPYWARQLPTQQADIVLHLVSSFLRVNRTLDEQATQERKQASRDSVKPVLVNVQDGENIVRVGEFVSPEVIEKARATGTLPKTLSTIGVWGMGLLSALLATTFILYLFFLQKQAINQPRPLFVIVISIIVTAIAARILQSLWPDQPYAFPLATTIIVLTIIFNLPIGLASAMLLSIVVGVLDGNNLSLTVTMFMGSAIAVFTIRGAERSLTFLLAGVGVAAITTLCQIAFCLLDPGRTCGTEMRSILLFSGTNGGLSAILSLGLFNLVGHAAGVVTPLKLMELAHPAQPLLRKLIQEAPGTYYHSVAVGNLAEAAANVIGADALLLRVAAYYHDIGKTLRPFFFTDNQMGRENIHNELDPHTSAEIIIDHVREGHKMANAAGLPQQIIDFIPTHHGTQLVGHFYQLALRQEDAVNIQDFRYPGPIPWTREQGILMLADSVEATARSKAQHGKLVAKRTDVNGQAAYASGGAQTIDDLVGSIIDERVRSGQLDNTSLTLRDLVLIRQAFIKSLLSIYHPRTEYSPQIVKQD